MRDQNGHLSDEQLLLELEGELSTKVARSVQDHLDACWRCRSRRQELEGAITGFIRFHQDELDPQLPSPDGPRALLKARLAELSEKETNRWTLGFAFFRQQMGLLATSVGVLAVTLFAVALVLHHPASASVIVSSPDLKLTPGAALLADRSAICALANVKNKAVPVAVRKRVLEEYGIRNAEPRAYEIDYLVTPALGGTDDIHNLWPHSYSADWNAKVKDDLEDRLREMVCSGSLDLTQAQREIATNWIAAYKKYFHTDQPLPSQ
jgi:hypothetical protein